MIKDNPVPRILADELTAIVGKLSTMQDWNHENLQIYEHYLHVLGADSKSNTKITWLSNLPLQTDRIVCFE